MPDKNSITKKDILVWVFILLLFLYHYGFVPESFIIQFIIYITGIGPLLSFDKWYSKYYNPSGDPIYNIITMIVIILGPILFWSWIKYRAIPMFEKYIDLFNRRTARY